jgi:hypothetical protein
MLRTHKIVHIAEHGEMILLDLWSSGLGVLFRNTSGRVPTVDGFCR